jgi:hypothetical protein
MALCSILSCTLLLFFILRLKRKHVLPSPHCEKCKNLTENNVLFYMNVKQSFFLQRIYWNVVKNGKMCVRLRTGC